MSPADKVTLEHRLRIPEGVLFRELDGEAVILHLHQGRYYGLDPVGTRIWELVAEDKGLGEILESLLLEFEVGRERLQEDLLELVEELLAEQLLEVEDVQDP